MIDVFNGELEKKKVGLTLHIGTDAQEISVGNEVCLRQILINVVGNAIKFTDEGKVSMDVVKKRGPIG